jgi:hypothetical protein
MTRGVVVFGNGGSDVQVKISATHRRGGTGAFMNSHREQIVALAPRHAIPAIYSLREYVAAGGLMSYGENLADFFRRAASYVDKISKGDKPGELPIEQPTRFDLVINRKTADALGVTIPAQLYIFAAAALSSGCKPHPATAPAGSNRSSHGGNEVAEAFG